MKKNAIALAGFALAVSCLIAGGAEASTMPKAEVDHSAFVFALGPSLAFDFKLAPQVSLGASLGLPFLVEGFNNGVNSRYDVRVVYRFLQQGGFSLSGIFGVWGSANFSNTTLSRWVGLELGLGLAYKFTPQLTGRLNIAGGYNFFGSRLGFSDFYPPASGFELGYKFSPSLEGTLGYNGQGDILGLRWTI
jgi:hypothetical protein